MAEADVETRVKSSASRATEDTVLSVERAFHIVEALSDDATGRSLSEIARDFAINKAIAQRLLDTLERLGIVWRDNARQRWHLTFAICNLGLRRLRTGGLLEQCVATLNPLAIDTGELVRLAVVERSERVTWVYSIAGARRSVRIDPNDALEIQLNTDAIAKAWLATMPFENALRLVRAQGAVAATSQSIVSDDALRADHAATIARGYAVSYEEQEPGVGAIAAPVVVKDLDGMSRCVGAVSLAAPTSRMDRARIETCAPALLSAVARLAATWPIDEAAGRYGRGLASKPS